MYLYYYAYDYGIFMIMQFGNINVFNSFSLSLLAMSQLIKP